jgi:hypothetical protein
MFLSEWGYPIDKSFEASCEIGNKMKDGKKLKLKINRQARATGLL